MMPTFILGFERHGRLVSGNGHRVEGKAQLALDACKETCAAPQDQSLSPDNVESAKRVVLNRHEGELRTTAYWASCLVFRRINSLKGLSVTDFAAVVESITAGTLALRYLGLDEDKLLRLLDEQCTRRI
jgi:hypothetical protein